MNFNCTYNAKDFKHLISRIKKIKIKEKPRINAKYFVWAILNHGKELKNSKQVGYSKIPNVPIVKYTR